MPYTNANAYDRIRTYTNAYQRIPNTDTTTNPHTQANADADTNASAFAYTQTKTNPDPHPQTGRKALRRRARRCVGARPAAGTNTGYFTGVFHFFHRIIHIPVESCPIPGFFSECSQNVFRKFGGFFKKGLAFPTDCVIILSTGWHSTLSSAKNPRKRGFTI